MNLDKYIKDLLFQLDRVAVKGLGTFITYTTNALINDKEKLIEPPRKAVSFSKDMDVDPDIFTTFVSEKENISSEYVSGEIEKYVTAIKEDVLSNKGYTILGVGTFLKEKTGSDFRFIPDPRANFNQSTFGLPSVGLPKKQTPTTPPPPIETTPIEKKSYFSKEKIVKEERKLEPLTNKVEETADKKEEKKGGDWGKLFGLKKEGETPVTEKTNIGSNYRKEEEKTVSSVLADNVNKEESIEVDPVPEFEEDVVEPKKSRMMGCLLPLLAAMLLGFLVLQVSNNTSLQNMLPFGNKNNTEVAENRGKSYVDEEDKVYNDNSSSTNTTNTNTTETETESTNNYEEVESETKNSTYTEVTDYADNNTDDKSTTKPKTTSPPPKPKTNNTTKPKSNNTSKTNNTNKTKLNSKGGGSSTKVYGNSEVPKGYYANIGVFRSRVNALKVAKETQAKGYPVYVTNYKADLYRIGIHLSEDSAESQRKLKNVKKNIKNDAWIYKN